MDPSNLLGVYHGGVYRMKVFGQQLGRPHSGYPLTCSVELHLILYFFTIFNDGYLGSYTDEERSEMR